MPLPSSATPLLLSLLAGNPILVPPTPAPWDVGAARHVELTAGGANQEYEVRVSPDRITCFVFNVPLPREGVVLEERELFHLVTVDEAHGTLLLLPSGALAPGRELRLTVRFADGAVPESVHFRLVVHPTRAEPQVNVYRQPRSAESYQQGERQERERAERCEARLTRAEAEGGPGGLVGLLESGLVSNEKGIAARDLTGATIQLPSNPLSYIRAFSYRAPGRVAVDMQMLNTSHQPWTLEGAELADKGGVRLDVVRVWPREPLAPGEQRHVRVEAEATDEQARGTWVLRLWEAGGPRLVTVRGVTFP